MNNGSSRTSNFVSKLNLVLLTCQQQSQCTDTGFVVKEIRVLISGCQARRMGCWCSKDLSGTRILKDNIQGEGCSSWTFFWLANGEVTGWCFRNLNHQPSGSNQSGIYCVGQHVDISTWVRVSFRAEQVKDICVRYICDYICPLRRDEDCFITELLFELSLLFLLDCFSFFSMFSHFPNW